MAGFSSTSSLLLIIAPLLLALALAVSLLLWRSTGRGLILLALVACALALVFVPLLRVLPERIGIPFFVAGLLPLVAILVMAMAVNIARFVQARTGTHLLSLALSIVALALFFVNTTTPWIWPYAVY